MMGPNPRGRKPPPIFAVTAAALALLALLAALDPFRELGNLPFTPAAWAAATADERGRMARDAARRIPAGASRERVRKTLGERELGGGADEWLYRVGRMGGAGAFGIDAAFLQVRFGPDGRVESAGIVGG